MSSVFDSLEEVDEHIAEYKKALRQVSQGYTFSSSDGRSFSYPDLPEIRKTLAWLRRERAVLEGSAGPKILRGRPKR